MKWSCMVCLFLMMLSWPSTGQAEDCAEASRLAKRAFDLVCSSNWKKA